MMWTRETILCHRSQMRIMLTLMARVLGMLDGLPGIIISTVVYED